MVISSQATTVLSTSNDMERDDSGQQSQVLPSLFQRYFDALNAADFQQAADMYSIDGVLIPPFEEPIIGRSAIETHLVAEASGMTFLPKNCECISSDDGMSVFRVKGKVSTSLFKVGVAWRICIDDANKITRVEIQLLATLRELLTIRQG